MTQHIESVAWMWRDSTGCVHMAGDRPDIYTAAATVAQLPGPLYDAAALAAAEERGKSEERERCAAELAGVGVCNSTPAPHVAVSDDVLLAACRAHTPQFDRLDVDIARYAKDQMREAITAAIKIMEISR